jgi:hypothetical protein
MRWKLSDVSSMEPAKQPEKIFRALEANIELYSSATSRPSKFVHHNWAAGFEFGVMTSKKTNVGL